MSTFAASAYYTGQTSSPHGWGGASSACPPAWGSTLLRSSTASPLQPPKKNMLFHTHHHLYSGRSSTARGCLWAEESDRIGDAVTKLLSRRSLYVCGEERYTSSAQYRPLLMSCTCGARSAQHACTSLIQKGLHHDMSLLAMPEQATVAVVPRKRDTINKEAQTAMHLRDCSLEGYHLT